jgi:hypothetical protein
MLKYYFLLLFFSISNLYAQNHTKNIVLCTNIDGVDIYPVYKESVKNSFIDSVIYADPFIIFCVSFQKPDSNKIYRLESPKSNKSWSCYNYRGTRHPIQILNIRCNDKLISEKLSEESLNIELEQQSGPLSGFSKISCEFKFCRADFIYGKAILSESFTGQKTIAEAINTIEFKDIRIRKKHFTKPLANNLIDRYINNFIGEKNQLFENVIVKINETVIDNSIFIDDASDNQKYRKNPLQYSVDKKAHNLIYLDKITQNDNQTIFSIRYYSAKGSNITLHNAKPNKYYLHQKTKKTQMQTIKNVCLNGKVISQEIKKGDVLKINKMNSTTILTFDVYFDEFPNNLIQFDLIEGKRIKETIPFDIYSIKF